MGFPFPRLRYPPLAWRNVSHGGRRSLAAISGAAFALTMVLLQLGFLEAVKITAVNNFEVLRFDAILLSSRYEQFYAPDFLPLERLRQAEGLEEVLAATPLYASFGLWRCPPYPLDSHWSDADLEAQPGALGRWLAGTRFHRPLQRRELFVLGFDPARPPFHSPILDSVREHESKLRLEDRVLLNSLSHPDFGWDLRDRFEGWELGSHAVEVVGGFPMLRGFAADSTVLCSTENFVKLCDYGSRETTNYGLLTLRPGEGRRAVERLREILPDDVLVYSRAEMLKRERNHWVHQTSTGKLFAFGVLVAAIVAVVVVQQVLSNDVREHLPEYATLKAMGYSSKRLAGVIVVQSLIYMLISFAAAVGIAAVVYRITAELAGVPMRLTLENLMLTLLLAVVVGSATGLVTAYKLRSAQPADLF